MKKMISFMIGLIVLIGITVFTYINWGFEITIIFLIIDGSISISLINLSLKEKKIELYEKVAKFDINETSVVIIRIIDTVGRRAVQDIKFAAEEKFGCEVFIMDSRFQLEAVLDKNN